MITLPSHFTLFFKDMLVAFGPIYLFAREKDEAVVVFHLETERNLRNINCYPYVNLHESNRKNVYLMDQTSKGIWKKLSSTHTP